MSDIRVNIAIKGNEGWRDCSRFAREGIHRGVLCIRFPLILLVILIHADNREIWVNGAQQTFDVVSPVAQWVRFWVSQGLARTAVPMFFAISGYLFFVNWDGTWLSLQKKWKHRIQSLLIPFLLWNGIAVSIVSLVQWRNPFGHGFIAGFNSLWGITAPNYLFHLWFLRDLMVMVAIAPIWRFLLAKIPIATLALLSACYLFYPWGFPWPSSAGMLFFALGAWVAQRPIHMPMKSFMVVLPLYVLLSMLDASTSNGLWGGLFHRLCIALGTLAWLGLAQLEGKWSATLASMGPASYFLYLAHEPLLRYTRYALNWFVGGSTVARDWLLYILPPSIVVFVLLWIYSKRNTGRHFAKLLRVLIGTRVKTK